MSPVLVIALLYVPVGDPRPGNSQFCLRSPDAPTGQICFPMEKPAEPPSADDQARLRAELERRAAEAREKLRARQQP